VIELPDGWTSTLSRDLADGSAVVLAERVEAVDLGPRKRNLFDQYTTFRLGPAGIIAGPIRWDRAAAEADLAEASR
jgi:hypothetical protein